METILTQKRSDWPRVIGWASFGTVSLRVVFDDEDYCSRYLELVPGDAKRLGEYLVSAALKKE
jgi:hypothetical protein